MTNNDEMALSPEQISWLHEAAEEHAAVGLKMTMKPDEMLQLTSTLRALLAERDADRAANAQLRQRIAELEARTVSLPTFEEYQPPIALELQGAFRIVCERAGINLEVGE